MNREGGDRSPPFRIISNSESLTRYLLMLVKQTLEEVVGKKG